MTVILSLILVYFPIFVQSVGDNCPYQECECEEDTIACDGHELKTLPKVQLVTITQPLALSITLNQITAIHDGELPPNLYDISLQQNPITTIDDDAFNGSVNTLTDLSFSEAHFTELPKAFLKLNVLKHLLIADTPMKTWDDELLKHLGQTLQTLILSNVGLTSWPTWIQYLPVLGTLELSQMVFHIPDDALKNQEKTLFSLNFENCSLPEIPKAFSNLTALNNLVLDSNNITTLSGLPKLSPLLVLSLDYNKVTDGRQISEAVLPYKSSLTMLQLRGNKLTYLPDLSAMLALNTLSLNDNMISTTGTAKLSASVVFLELMDNRLFFLSSFMQPCVNLSTINFNHNFITEINNMDIPTKVNSLDLSYNQIKELTDTSFQPNAEMHSLTLDYNPISKISLSAFTNLKKLEYLSMMSTKLTRLPVSLGALTDVNGVNLGNNAYLVCTCLEKDLRQWYLSHYIHIDGNCGITTIEFFLEGLSQHCPNTTTPKQSLTIS